MKYSLKKRPVHSLKTWIIVGATSQIAESFAHLVAQKGHALLLVARNQQELEIIAADIRLRYRVSCETMVVDCSKTINLLLHRIKNQDNEWSLMFAQGAMHDNAGLNSQTIEELLAINTIITIQLINAYWHKKQNQHQILFLSSVAACRGRAKNSLYGASKAAVEVYLQGLQQTASNKKQITIARLGYIDTQMTYGKPGIFYASSPVQCAKACWNALENKKDFIYYPLFWRYIMTIIKHMPKIAYARFTH